MLSRTGHRHVEDAPLLLIGLLRLLLLDLLERHALGGAARHGRDAQAHTPVVGYPQGVVVLERDPAEVGHAHHWELEPLGRVDRHEPHRVDALRLEWRLALTRAQHVLLGDEVDEAAQVAPLVRLVLAREAHELAHVRHPALAVWHAEDHAVVLRARDRPIDQGLEREPRRGFTLRIEALDEPGDLSRVLGREISRL